MASLQNFVDNYLPYVEVGGSTCDPRTFSATVAPVVSRCNYARYVGAKTSISSLRLYVDGEAFNISVAVYSNVGEGAAAGPSVRKATTGDLAFEAEVGVRRLALDSTIDINPGDWIGLSTGAAGGVQYGGPIASLIVVPEIAQYEAGAHPCPATAAPAGASAQVFWVST